MDYLKSNNRHVITFQPLPISNGATFEILDWKSNLTPHFTGHVITYPCWDLSKSILVKGALEDIFFSVICVSHHWQYWYWISRDVIRQCCLSWVSDCILTSIVDILSADALPMPIAWASADDKLTVINEQGWFPWPYQCVFRCCVILYSYFWVEEYVANPHSQFHTYWCPGTPAVWAWASAILVVK